MRDETKKQERDTGSNKPIGDPLYRTNYNKIIMPIQRILPIFIMSYGEWNLSVTLVQVIMRLCVQFVINSTSDVWKFCQNWLSRLWQNYTLRRKTFETLYPGLLEDDSQWQHHILSLNLNLVLLFVTPFALNSSGAISFVFKWLSATLLSAILFVLAKSIIVLLFN